MLQALLKPNRQYVGLKYQQASTQISTAEI